MNNSILNDVLKEYEKRRLSNTYKLEKRKQELYTSNPELREIDNKLSEFSINTAKCILQNNSKEYLENLNRLIEKYHYPRYFLSQAYYKSPETNELKEYPMSDNEKEKWFNIDEEDL